MNPPPFDVLQPPAAPEELARLAEEVGSTLPKAYLDFLRATNGAEGGPNDADGDSLRLCAAGEVMDFNRDFRVQEYLPELLCFASDGGDYAFAFLRKGAADRWPVVRVPLGALFDNEIQPVAPSFAQWAVGGFCYDSDWAPEQGNKVEIAQRQRRMALAGVRSELTAAWQAKDHARVVALLEPWRAELTAVELKKLEYARKQLRGN